MYRTIACAVLIVLIPACLVSAETSAEISPSEIGIGFEWPEIDANVLQDARLHHTEHKANENYRRAQVVADRAKQDAGKVPALLKEHEAIRERVSESAVLEFVQIGQEAASQGKIVAGVIEYETGATASGLITFLNYPELSHWGALVVIAPPGNVWTTFEGDITRPTQSQAYPMEGVLTYSNGDRFTGLFYTWGGASGIYEKADGSLRFSGQFKTDGLQVQPRRGVMKDQSRQLLAVLLD